MRGKINGLLETKMPGRVPRLLSVHQGGRFPEAVVVEMIPDLAFSARDLLEQRGAYLSWLASATAQERMLLRSTLKQMEEAILLPKNEALIPDGSDWEVDRWEYTRFTIVDFSPENLVFSPSRGWVILDQDGVQETRGSNGNLLRLVEQKLPVAP
jgi:hypothetical protein